jgi:hypothetical protein
MVDDSDTVEIFVEDPTSGERHRFTGATDAEAIRSAEMFFGVDEADADAAEGDRR